MIPATPMQIADRSLVIIADDLTGACDAAVAFAATSASVRVEIDGVPPVGTDIWAINTESRDLPQDEAIRRLAVALQQLQGNEIRFKKIDSVFRGNSFAEIGYMLQHLPYDLAILAPAYPALGRRVISGGLHIQDVIGERILSIEETLTAQGHSLHRIPSGLSISTLKQEMEFRRKSRTRSFLCDAREQRDLHNIVEAALLLNEKILWIGSGGLAHALAATLKTAKKAETPASRLGDTLFLIGSDHPVTQAQVTQLRTMAGMTSCEEIPDRSTGRHSVLFEIVRGKTTEHQLLHAVEGISRDRLGCVFMSGGDTALFACRALGIRSLRLLREFVPGMPLGIAEGGVLDGITIVLKSGGFGETDVLCRLVDEFRRKEEVTS